MSVRKKRIRGLDGLKVIALLGVLIYHTFPKVLPGGYLGVVLFFVISGYLSAYGNLEKMEKGKFSLKEYYKKRVLRLYPSLLIVLLSAIAVMTLIAPVKLANTQKEFFSVIFGYNNFWQIGMNADYFAQLSKNSPFTHLWYIAILLQFDLLFPFLLKGYVTIKQKKGTGTALIISFVIVMVSACIMPVSYAVTKGSNITALYYSTFTRICPLLAGMALGLLHAEKIRILNRHLKRPIFGILEMLVWMSLYIVLYFVADGTEAWVYLFGMNLCTLVACRMIEVLRTSIFTGKLLENPITKWIGRYNYEIYLWQYPVLLIAGILKFTDHIWQYGIQIAMILLLSMWLSEFSNRLNLMFQ